MTDVLTSSGAGSQLSEAELQYLQSFLDAGDRAGFYMAYYSLVVADDPLFEGYSDFGKLEASLQTKVATFSGSIGATAYLSNRLLEELYPQVVYPGIYDLSQRVAQSALTFMRQDLGGSVNDDGLISDPEFFNSARAAWNSRGLSSQFPGLLLGGSAVDAVVNTAAGVVAYVAWLTDYVAQNGQLPGRDAILGWVQNSSPDWIGGTAAALSSLYVAASGIEGKQIDDFRGRPGYTIIETPDDNQTLVIDSQGHVVAAHSDPLSNGSSQYENADYLLSFLRSSIGLTSTLGQVGVTTVESLAATLNSLFAPHMPSSWADLTYPVGEARVSDLTHSATPSPFRATATAGNDTLVGTASFLGHGGSDVIAGGAGNDAIFGGGGEDRLLGDDGNDILWGHEQNDHLEGGLGNDVIRGGDGDDLLRPGSGSDIVDGGAPDVSRATDGADTADYSDLGNFNFITVNLGGTNTLDVMNGVFSIVEATGSDLLTSIERIIGTDYADLVRVMGNGPAQFSAIEWIDLGQHLGVPNGDGARFVDTIDLSAGAAAAVVNLRDVNNQVVVLGTLGAPLRLRNVEGIIGTQYDDRLYGVARGDAFGQGSSIVGGAGEDRIYGGSGNDRLEGGADNDYIDGGSGTNIIDGGTGNDDRLVSRGQNDTVTRVERRISPPASGQSSGTAGNAIEDRMIIAFGATTTIEDSNAQDRVFYSDIQLSGGVAAWWSESNIALNAPIMNIASAFPGIGSGLIAAGAVFADTPWMKFAMYRQESNGDVTVRFGYGLGGYATIKDYEVNLAQGGGVAGLTIFRQGGQGRTAAVDQGTGNYVNLALKAAWGPGHGLDGFDPLVLDLDGDGYDVTAREYSQVYFDFEGNGFAKQSGWVLADDALLARDTNSNGVIDNGTELFGNRTQSGFSMLSALDSNSDGMISSADVGFNSLRVWRDLNQDGVSQTDELQTLAQSGISSIGLNAVDTPDGTEVRGNTVARTALFTRTDGTTSAVGDITFGVSDLNTRWTGTGDASAAAMALPQLGGLGLMRDLRNVMTDDSQLLSMVNNLVGSTGESIGALLGQVDDILFRWAGVDGVAANALGTNGFDERKLAFLEKYSGVQLLQRNSDGTINPLGLERVEALWDYQFPRLALKLLAQGPLSETLSGLSYNEDIDQFLAAGPSTITTILDQILDGMPAAAAQAEAYWNDWGQLLGSFAGSVVRSSGANVGSDFLFTQLVSAVDGRSLPLTLTQLASTLAIDGIHIGSEGTLTRTAGDTGTQVWFADQANSVMTGGGGQDAYIFGHSIGNAVITDVEGRENGDRIRFAFLNSSDVSMARAGNDLLITVTATGETVRVVGQYAPVTLLGSDNVISDNRGVEDIQFADGTIMEAPQIAIEVGRGSAGNDHLIGTMHTDVLQGMAGNDLMEGGDDADLYYVEAGGGHDTIRDLTSTPYFRGMDMLIFGDGLAPEDLHFSRAGASMEDLVITMGDGSQSVLIDGQFDYSSLGYDAMFALNTRIESFTFRNFAETYSARQLQDLMVEQSITEGDDTTFGFGGADTLLQSSGNDLLVGFDGADTYHFGEGSGHDTIDERSRFIDVEVGLGGISLTVRADTIVFGEGITVDEVLFRSLLADNDLHISLTTSADTLVVNNQFGGFQTGVLGAQWFDRVEWFEFADGTKLSWQDVLSRVTTGTAGNDQMRGDLFADTFRGGAGNDFMSGRGVGDTYIFNVGDGHDTIDDANTDILGNGFINLDTTPDILQFGVDIAPGDLSFERNGSDVDIIVGSNGDRVTLVGQDSYIQTGVFGALNYSRIEQIQFANGTVWSWQEINRQIIASFTTAGDDVTQGFTLEDRFEASAGNDILMGGESGDTYVFGVGSGDDIIREGVGHVLYGDYDVLEFAGSILPDDVSLTRSGNDLTLTLATGDSITIEGEFAYQAWYTWTDIELFQFSNGTVWDKLDIQERLLASQSTAGDDVITGFNDNDVIDGGAGNDTLQGGEGSDTYRFDRGYGHDEIFEGRWNTNLGEYDSIELAAGIVPDDVTLTRDGNDLILTLDSGDTLTVRSHFIEGTLNSSMVTDIEEIRFANGTVWDKAAIANLYFHPTAGDDVFVGTRDAQAVEGLGGDDHLEGRGGADTYLYNQGDGNDTIVDASGGTNRISFGPGITPTDLRLTNNPANQGELLISFASGAGSIRVIGQWSDNAIEAFDFADGTSWDFGQISAAFMVGQRTAGNDMVFGSVGADVIDGGAGNDSLVGYAGDDTYLLGRGGGSDTIFDRGTQALIGYNGGGNDTIEFAQDILPGDVEVYQLNANDLALRISGTGDQIVMLGAISDPGLRIEQARFADGTVWDYQTMLAATLLGTSGDDVLSAGTTASTIGGRGGNDTLTGSEYADTLTGGTGNDLLRGGGGNDAYRFSLGDGQDTIYDFGAPGLFGNTGGGFDTIELAAGINQADVQLVQVNANDLLLRIAGTSDQILMQGALSNSINRIDALAFADGATWNYSDILTRSQVPTDGNDTIYAGFSASTLTGAAGNDILHGSDLIDSLAGGAGSDTLYGGGGGDTYHLGRGDGSDTIIDRGPNGLFGPTDGGIDTIQFEQSILPADVEVYQLNANDLVIRISGTSDQFIMAGAISGTVQRIETARFDDGTVWDYATMLAMTLLGTSGDDTISAGTTPSTIGGRAGNDTLTGSEGSDILTGGTGTDTLRGGGGNDTYRFNLGDGQDTIFDRGAPGTWGDNEGGVDTIELGLGIAPADVRIVQVNANDLLLTIVGTTDQILMQGALANAIYTIDKISFADGTLWSYADILSRSQIPTAGNDTLYAGFTPSTLSGDGGNDILTGSTGSDVLDGGTGTDRLSGYSGNDTYRFGIGDGVDTVDDHGYARYWGYEDGGVDSVELDVGLDQSDVRLTQISANDIALEILGTSDRLILSGQISNPAMAVESIRFADGSQWGVADIFARSLLPTEGDDVRYAGSTPSTLAGGGGNDQLYGSTGSDILQGDAGNDRLEGYSGADTYRYTLGDGSDVINDHGYARYWGYEDGGVDRLELTGVLEGDFGVFATNGGADILLVFRQSSDVITLVGAGTNAAQRIETIRFGNGLEWTHADLMSHLNASYSSGNDVINGTAGDDWLRGGAGNDTLSGADGNDRLDGDDGNDTIDGGNGNDALTGGNGDDTLRAGPGENLVNGGAGTDSASYTGATAGVTVDLATLVAQVTVGAGADQLISVEGLIGSEFGDILSGDAQPNAIIGGVGNDQIDGRDGDDILTGGQGDDTLAGGIGNDTFNYSGAAEGLDIVDGGSGTDSIRATAANTVIGLGSVQGVEAITSNGFANVTIGGSSNGDTLNFSSTTLTGIVRIDGNAGNDVITGSAGNDTIAAGDGNDAVEGGLGNDSINGGLGVDVVSYAAATAAVTVSLLSTVSQNTVGAGSDTLSGFENLTGSSFNDVLTGDGNANLIDGGAGNDRIDGGAGDDTLFGGLGSDTLSYISAGAGITSSLSIATAQATGGAGTDTAAGFENLTGSAFNDGLTGDASANIIDGGSGNDVIEGGAGDDTLIGGTGTDTVSFASAAAGVTASLATTIVQATGGAGNDGLSGFENLTGSAFNDALTGDAAANVITGGAGDDLIEGAAGNDLLDGGLGVDTVVYASASSGVTVSLANAAGQNTVGAGTDTLTAFENLTGSAFNDTLSGDALANIIDGGHGNDLIEGGASDDTLVGGLGVDRLSYASASSGITADLSFAGAQATGGAGNDTASGFENLTGSAFNDMLNGDLNANAIDAGAGNDIVDGGAGNDSLVGGAGVDTLLYASATGAVTASLAVTAAQATGGSGSDTISGFENLTGSSFGDTLIGDANANLITGGAGNDVIDGGAGSDALDGGLGTDTISYLTAGAAINVSLVSTSAQVTGGSGTDTLIGFENLVGSNFNDTLTGDANANVVDGGSGNDIIDGGAGDDSLIGGAGIDVLSYASASSGVTSSLMITTAQATGGAGTDTASGFENLTGSAFNDALTGDANANTLNGGSGNDVLDGGAGNDILNGGLDTDTISYASATAAVAVNLTITASQATGGSGSDTLTAFENLTGSAFNDTLTGDVTANGLTGAAGNDLLTGGAGNDLLDGGDGTDTANFAGLMTAYQLQTANGQVMMVDTDAVADGNDGTDTLIGIEVAKFKNGTTMSMTSPIILDLDGNGVQTVSAANSQALFDMDGDGVADDTSWIGATDGFLFLDRNGDGTLSGISEMSFTQDVAGARTDLDGLKAFDSNGDGVLSNNDARFADFRIWRDTNSDGAVDQGEVLTLTAVNLDTLDLTGVANSSTVNIGEVAIVNTGSWTQTNGAVMQFADASMSFFSTSASSLVPLTGNSVASSRRESNYQFRASGGTVSLQLRRDRDANNTVAAATGVLSSFDFRGRTVGMLSTIILDLDDDGIEMVRSRNSGARLDMNGDGIEDRTGWIGKDDAILVIDRNNDGRITTNSELAFGLEDADASNSLQALGRMDSNFDGRIDTLDARFGELKIWRDANGNGVTDAGEMVTLADAGIQAINLAEAAMRGTANVGDNILRATASFTRTDGSTSTVGDAHLGFRPSVENPAEVDGIFEAIRRNNLFGDERNLEFWDALVEQASGHAGGRFGLEPLAYIASSAAPTIQEDRRSSIAEKAIDRSSIEQGRQLAMIAQDLASFGASHSTSMELRREDAIRPAELFAA